MSRILITGAGGGIARAIIPVLHELGHSLLLTTRSRIQELKTYLEEQGIKAAVKSADLTIDEDVEELFNWVNDQGGLVICYL